MLAAVVVVLQQRCNTLHINRLLGNQSHVCAAGNASRVGNPAGIAAHHFNHDDAIVRVGGGADAVHGLGGDGNCCVVAKGGVSAVNVVVDGLGHAHGVNAVLGQEERDRLRVVAAKSNQCVNFVELQDFLNLLNAAGNLLHVGAR